jgi:hypothetical protein
MTMGMPEPDDWLRRKSACGVRMVRSVTLMLD